MINLLNSIRPHDVKNKINELIAEIRRLDIIPGYGIAVSKLINGRKIDSTLQPGGGPGGGGGATYDGPFTVLLDVSGDQMQVICRDGKDPKATVAGYIRVGSKMEAISVQTWDAKAGTVYAEVLYTDGESEDDEGSFTIDVFFEDELPEDSDPKRWILRIAEVVDDEGVWKVTQIWTGGDITVSGRWVK